MDETFEPTKHGENIANEIQMDIMLENVIVV